jgi:uroporphyrinogen decarboxylase
MEKLCNQAKKYNKKIALHSCGAIGPFIPLMIDSGIDVLHPLQAKATGMEPERLMGEYGKDLIFMGGVDTQELLPFGTAQQVKDEVHRLREIFGPGFIVSPSHEAILPNVPIENMLAMSEAAVE